jgi:cobalt/nickel transport system permease protein
VPVFAIIIFKLIAGKSDSVVRLNTAAFFSGYLSLNVAAITTAIEFGIQPLIAVSNEGNALYAPYPLKVALPAMALEHLILFGFIEGIVTMLIFSYFYKSDKNIIAIIKT